jgi:hypothetical protein
MANGGPTAKIFSQVVREFEAESASYLVCARLGIDTASDEYLIGYVGNVLIHPQSALIAS